MKPPGVSPPKTSSRALLPGGYLCLGHAESMSRISALFEICRFEDAIVYRRPIEVKNG